jgi:glutamyl-tRNA synthetase
MLTSSTYFAGATFGWNDAIIWGTIRSNASASGSVRKPGRPHILRWYTQVETTPIAKGLLESWVKARSNADKSRKVKREEGHIEAELKNAVPGKVVVRFGALTEVLSSC